MSNYPADLKYRPSHEWVRIEGDVATVGVSWFAQDSLGDVVYVDMPELGAQLSAGEEAGEIESVKAVSNIYAPLSGEVVEINDKIEGDEAVINTDPYTGGWLFKIRLSSPGEVDGLMDSDAYTAHCEAQ